MKRREFTRLVTAGAVAPLFARAAGAWPPPPLPKAPAEPDEHFWESVRAQFLMPPDLAMLNAANLCPSSAPVLDALYRHTRDVDEDPSFENRAELGEAREATRRRLAEFLRVSPEEIIITRNTSEANNLVSSGVDLGPSDEVLIHADNHPSSNIAWKQKGKRFGYTVREIPTPNPYPGPAHYLEAFAGAITPRTKVIAFTHLTSTVGDLLPARELCRLARERGILTLVDGAQSFGLLDLDLADMQPDFFSGSAHKWPCGPKEAGVLYVNRAAQPKIWASIYSAYPGAIGLSKTFESFGQRDEAAILAFGEALAFQSKVGRPLIERRARALTTELANGLRAIDGVKVWTSDDPAWRAAIVSFQPAALDQRKLAAALYAKDRIGCATRSSADRPGIRFSPHFYNTRAEIDRALAAVRRYVTAGL
ncbi:MAG TPA: aminotransferase class V-fold PLP-dependent enzyme [Vicinamibacterales bacterium]|nr:aminotransferase class V-fold PLP-dependent enzyme [Vicinamibacterales bacterium]